MAVDGVKGSDSSKEAETPLMSRQVTMDDEDLGSQPGSRLGFEVRTSSRKKKRDSSLNNEEGHKVTFTVTIAQAVPSVKNEVESSSAAPVSRMSRATTAQGTADEDSEGRSSRRKRVMEAPRAQNLYHLEYVLVPDDTDQAVRTDLVNFGVAAKIFTEKQEAKVIKTWVENDQTWVAWTHCHTVTMTEELLRKMFTHTIELRVWDTRDKISTRAKMDRPRAFKFPPVKAGEDHTGGVKTLVIKQSKSFEKMQPKRPYIDRPLPSQPRLTYEMDPIRAQLDREAKDRASKHKKTSKAHKLPPGECGDPVPEKLNEYLDKAGHRIVDDGTGKTPAPPTIERTYSRVNQLAGNSKPGSRQSGKPKSSKSASPTRSPNEKPSTADSTKKRKQSNAVAGHKSSTPQPHSRNKNPELASNPPSSVVSVTKNEQTKAGNYNQAEQQQEPAAANQHGAPPGTMMSTQSAEGAPRSAGRRGRDKKKEREAAAQAELIKKHGKCCVSIRMAKFFAGMQTITERLTKPVDTIPDMFLSVSVNKPLMNDELKRTLNPLVVKVHSATNMPATPLHYDELKLRCQPAYVKYNFFQQGEHSSVGREHDRNIYWDDINVVLAGTMEPSELREYLSGPPLEIEVHDRDRVIEKQKLKATLFGDDLEDEKISNVGTIASRRTLHNAFEGRDKPWDPHGVAKFDLSDLLLGQQVLHLKAPIHACALPDVLGQRDGKQDGKLMGVSGAVDGPVDNPLQAGNYLDSSAMLKIKVEVAYPLITPQQVAQKEDTVATHQCPFARIIFKFDYKNVSFLQKIQSLITEINARALGLEDMPPHVIEAALSTYKLSVEQQQSRDMDIITGFHVLDGTLHMFVLEGLRDQAVKYVWESLPKPTNNGVDVLYNSELSFGERIYGPLDVDVCRIKLHEPLSCIVQQPLLYVRDMVPKPCFEALVKLDQLAKCEKLRDAWRSDLFPSADMVVSMSREFGVPITADDFEELTPQLPQIREEAVRHYAGPTTSRIWTPIDNYNDSYMERVMERERTGITADFSRENRSMVRERSNLNKLARSKTSIRASVQVPHNYSSQTLNSTEQAKEKLRQLLSQNPDQRYTYCQDYHHSMTVVPINVPAVQKEEAQASIDAWKSPAGWTYPGRKTFQESNANPKKPDPARIDELQEPWMENYLHAKMRPVLERDRYSWDKRNQDINIWTKPDQTFGKEPPTIHLAGEKLKQERLTALQADAQTWQDKIVVEDTRGHFHRLNPETELTDKGPKASNQLDKLKGVLKDSPHKYSLKKQGLAITDIAPLNVVLNPSVDTQARLAGKNIRPALENEFDQKVKGLRPGNDNEGGWLLDRNVIPSYDYQHQRYVQQRGHDFNAYHKERSTLHKRATTLLTDEEYNTHLFRLPSHLAHFRHQAAYIIPNIGEFQHRMEQHHGNEVVAKEGENAAVETMATTGLGPSLVTNKEATMVEV